MTIQYASAILVFTTDECFYGKDGKEVWRPSENVVHELGAASILYGGKIIILKEAGLTLPGNFSSRSRAAPPGLAVVFDRSPRASALG